MNSSLSIPRCPRLFLNPRGFLVLAWLYTWTGQPARASDNFEKVQSIFAEKCLLCHGPDDRKGGLRLTSLSHATSVLDSGQRAIVPGDPEKSGVILRIESTDPDQIMPPPGKSEPLTAAERATLRQWIRSGADWPVHWAFRPLVRPDTPEVMDDSWIRNPVDAFVLKNLETRGIRPSPEAEPSTLIRRVYLDLLGLNPSLQELSHHLEAMKTNSEASYVALVDSLLDNVHFGERWGRHWLDKARYADSDGYEKDRDRPDAWRYRDWVLQAINQDLPMDRFTQLQFGGDLLANPSPQDRLATAFNRQTLTNTEGGTDQEQWRVAAVMDRVETMGSVWLGLTLTCARCHTHKYDDITQREYYQLFACFNNGDESTSKVHKSQAEWEAYEQATREHRQKVQNLKLQSDAARQELKAHLSQWRDKTLANWPTDTAASPEFAELSAPIVEGPKGMKFEVGKDGVVRVRGTISDQATYNLKMVIPKGPWTGLVLEVLPDDSLPGKGPGYSSRGNFVLNEVKVQMGGKSLVLGDASSSFAQSGWPVEGSLQPSNRPNQSGEGWAVAPEFGKPHSATYGLAQPVHLDEDTPIQIQLVQNYGSKHVLGSFRVRCLTSPTELMLPKDLAPRLSKDPSTWTEEDQAALLAHFERLDARTASLAEQLADLNAKAPKEPLMEVRVLSERLKNPRPTHVLHRGEFKQPTEQVQPGVLSVLPSSLTDSVTNRLEVARWLMNGENPLPPRVLANQVWAHLFGEGIVPTLNDFGVRGDPPSHPELLDWLASEWIHLGWSRKQLIRTIVLSATYRQSSHHRPELQDLDPNNRWLARQNRFRVEAEVVRDLSLQAGGLLDLTVGGPSVFPPLPESVAALNYNSAFKWKTSTGGNRYRRGLYTYFKRTAPHPNLTTLDCPDSNVTCVQRTRSNTPLAALITLNNETFVEAARALGHRLLAALPEGTPEDQFRLGFRVVLARDPNPTELNALIQLHARARRWYESHPEEASTFAGKDTPDAPTLAALSATSRVLLNLDEFITRN